MTVDAEAEKTGAPSWNLVRRLRRRIAALESQCEMLARQVRDLEAELEGLESSSEDAAEDELAALLNELQEQVESTQLTVSNNQTSLLQQVDWVKRDLAGRIEKLEAAREVDKKDVDRVSLLGPRMDGLESRIRELSELLRELQSKV